MRSSVGSGLCLFRKVVLGFMATISLLVVVVPATASVHLILIREIYPGSPGNPDAEFIELQMYSGGQTVTQNQSVTVYGPTGAVTGTFKFLTNQANGANQASILLATAQAQSQFGITPDLSMTPSIDPAGGRVCFGSIDCASWGSYATVSGSGSPFNQGEGLVLGASMGRDSTGGSSPTSLDAGDDTNSSAADFLMEGPTPRNNSGASGAVSARAGLNTGQVSALETDGTLGFTVSRTTSDSELTVEYKTIDGSATEGTDYVPTSGAFTFAPGETSKSLSVTLLSSAEEEYNETFRLALRQLSQGVFSIPEAQILVRGELSPQPPSAPLAPTTTVLSSSSIRLAWSAPSSNGGEPVTGYKVYRGTASGALSAVAVVGNVLNHTSTGLASATTYYFQVSAVNATGEGPLSAEVSGTTLKAAPSFPRNPTAETGPGLGEVTLTWEAPTTDGGDAIKEYEIQRKGLTGNFATIARLNPASLSELKYVDRGCSVITGTRCTYRIYATNNFGRSPASSEVSAIGTKLP